MATKTAEKRTVYNVSTKVTVPKGKTIPNAKAVKEAFSTGLKLSQEDLVVGKVTLEATKTSEKRKQKTN